MAVLRNRRYPEWAAPGTALTGPLPEGPEGRREACAARLLELARVSLAIIDIEAARDCVLPQARVETSSDDFGYDIELCNALKRGLLRVERLTDLDVSSAVWRLRPDKEGTADVVLAGSTYPRQFIEWDRYSIPAPDAMRRAFEGGPAPLFSDDGQWCSVFVPLRDSLDDIVAVLELCAALAPADPYV